MENTNTRRLIFLSVFELKSSPYKIQLMDNSVRLDKLKKLKQFQTIFEESEFLCLGDVCFSVAVVVAYYKSCISARAKVYRHTNKRHKQGAYSSGVNKRLTAKNLSLSANNIASCRQVDTVC